MKITILNKMSVKEYEPEKNSILIRVSSQLPFSKIKENRYKEIYHYAFEDLPYESSYSISKEESLNLVKNLIENKDKEEIVIHCDYAQGRSPGIALAFSYILFGEDKYNIKEKYPDHNKYVVEMILNSFNIVKNLSDEKIKILLKDIKGEINVI